MKEKQEPDLSFLSGGFMFFNHSPAFIIDAATSSMLRNC